MTLTSARTMTMTTFLLRGVLALVRAMPSVAFAISPVAAYLPQYLTLREQANNEAKAASKEEEERQRRKAAAATATAGAMMLTEGGGQRRSDTVAVRRISAAMASTSASASASHTTAARTLPASASQTTGTGTLPSPQQQSSPFASSAKTKSEIGPMRSVPFASPPRTKGAAEAPTTMRSAPPFAPPSPPLPSAEALGLPLTASTNCETPAKTTASNVDVGEEREEEEGWFSVSYRPSAAARSGGVSGRNKSSSAVDAPSGRSAETGEIEEVSDGRKGGTGTDNGKSNSNSGGTGGGGGMSPLSVLILLSSHLLRLLYFYGLAQQRRWQRQRQSLQTASDLALEGPFDSGASNNHEEAMAPMPMQTAPQITQEEEEDELPYDLIVQSAVMIGVQLLLVKAMARNRRARMKRSLDDAANHRSDFEPSTEAVGTASTTPSKAKVAAWSDVTSDLNSLLSARHPITSSVLRFLLAVLRRILRLFHPARIWNYPTFREHVQFLALLSVGTFLHAQFVLFRRSEEDNGGLGGPGNMGGSGAATGKAAAGGIDDEGVRLVRNASVVLESCLALPQLAQNYLRGDTAGLSLVMVGGWIAGDFMKLVYFLLQASRGTLRAAAATTIIGGDRPSGGASGSGNGNPGSYHDGTAKAFAAGCVLALALDVAVALQMLLWYPTPDVMLVRDAVTDAVKRGRGRGARKTRQGHGSDRQRQCTSLAAEVMRILMGRTGVGGKRSGNGGGSGAPREGGSPLSPLGS